jgi:outer membrane protein TolC
MDAELAVADRHIVEAEEERAVARSNLRALVGDELELSERAPPLRTTYPLPDPEHLTEVALSSRGDVRAVLARQRGARARAEATHSEATSPAFEFRATYMQTPSARAGLGAMVGMSLPWLWGDGPDLNESAKHELDAVESDLEEVGRTIRIEVARAAGRVRAQSRSLDMLLERELPAADAALEAERSALRNGGFNLVSWIQSAHALREAHVDEARTRAALQRAWVELELTVGRPLDDAAGEKGDGR